jgi:GT2 family glycosyltransferase
VIDASHLVRVRRTDAEQALGNRAQYPFGFFGFLHFERGGEIAGPIRVELWQQGGLSTVLQCAATVAEDSELRNTALSYLAGASFFGNPAIESMSWLARGVGHELIEFNKTMTRRLVRAPYVERFGSPARAPRGTIIVCIYGKAEFFFLQNCLFSGLPGLDDYEFIYVCNSPELAETLLSEAHSASLLYGIPHSIVILAGNAGFGGANNAATRVAGSNRLLIVNPDVFPRDRAWAAKHSALLDTATPEETRIFGLPLYYDDGSLMHGGMYFDVDVGLSLSGGQPIPHRLCRVEHYGKGTPSETNQFSRARPVPAITGAFISIERAWFEQLGGFTEDFIFGHYEDADLCLKSIEMGSAPWLQDIQMWHLEGKGSVRQAAHEGGSLVNRWLFSQRWLSSIEADLIGPAPTHALFRAADTRSPSLNAAPTARSKASGRGRSAK